MYTINDQFIREYTNVAQAALSLKLGPRGARKLDNDNDDKRLVRIVEVVQTPSPDYEEGWPLQLKAREIIRANDGSYIDGRVNWDADLADEEAQEGVDQFDVQSNIYAYDVEFTIPISASDLTALNTKYQDKVVEITSRTLNIADDANRENELAWVISSALAEESTLYITGRITGGSTVQYNIEILDNRIEQNVTDSSANLKLVLDDIPFEPLQVGEIYTMEKFNYSIGSPQNVYYQLVTNIFLRP